MEIYCCVNGVPPQTNITAFKIRPVIKGSEKFRSTSPRKKVFNNIEVLMIINTQQRIIHVRHAQWNKNHDL